MQCFYSPQRVHKPQKPQFLSTDHTEHTHTSDSRQSSVTEQCTSTLYKQRTHRPKTFPLEMEFTARSNDCRVCYRTVTARPGVRSMSAMDSSSMRYWYIVYAVPRNHGKHAVWRHVSMDVPVVHNRSSDQRGSAYPAQHSYRLSSPVSTASHIFLVSLVC